MNVTADIWTARGSLRVDLYTENGWANGSYMIPAEVDTGWGVRTWVSNIAKARGLCVTNLSEAEKAAWELLLR